MLEPEETWNQATPQDIPEPTYWPAILGLGIALIFWGFLTVFIIGFLGAAVFILALGGWISELRHEFITNNEKRSSDGS